MSDWSGEYIELDNYFLGLYQFWRDISVDSDERPNTLDDIREALDGLADAIVYFRGEVEDVEEV